MPPPGGGIERDRELLSPHEFAITDGLGPVSSGADDPVLYNELIEGDAEPRRRALQERFTSGGASKGQVRPVEIGRMRLRSGCRSLIGSERGVALNETNAIERNRELFGNQLRLSRVEAMAELAFAGVGGDVAI